jgi:hypothetical protein
MNDIVRFPAPEDYISIVGGPYHGKVVVVPTGKTLSAFVSFPLEALVTGYWRDDALCARYVLFKEPASGVCIYAFQGFELLSGDGGE